MEGARFACSIIAVLCAFFSGFSAFEPAAETIHRQLTAGSIIPGHDDQGTIGQRLVRRGIPVLRPCAHLLMQLHRFNSLAGCCVATMEQKGYRTSRESIATLVCAVMIAGGVAGGLMGRSVVFGFAVAGGSLAIIHIVVQHDADNRLEKMRQAVPDVLHSMGVCFGVGYSLLQTFQHLSIESPECLRPLFTRAARDIETGSTVEEALNTMRAETSVSELSFVAVALDIQHTVGGSMQQVLESARESLESELALRRSLRVHTAQAKLSARVVVLVTIGMIASLSVLNNNFLLPFFSSYLGVGMLCLALVMQIAGILSVRRLLNVEVD